MALDLGTLVGHVDLDTRDYDSKYRQVRTAWTQLGQVAPADLTVQAQVATALSDLDRARAAVRAFDGVEASAEVTADHQAALADLAAAEAAVRALDGDEAVVAALADTDRALAGVGSVDDAIRALNGERAVVDVDADTGKAESALADFADDAKAEGNRGGKGFATGLLAGIAAIPIAGAVVAIGKSLVDAVMDGFKIDAQRDLFGARTGLDEATAAKFGRAAGNAYADNWGESVEDNLEVARQAFANGLIDPRATEADTSRIIAQFQAVAQVMEEDVSIAARAAGNMIKNGLVKDVEGAVDLMIAAQQRGINTSEDFFDTFIEYAGNFKQMGIDGATAVGLMDQAIEAGVFNTDVLGDSIKEFGIIVGEMAEPAADAFERIGLNADEMKAAITEGGPAASDALAKVLDRLREMEAQGLPTQEAITAIFGGPGENLGPALFALDLAAASEAMEDTAGTAERAMARIGDNTASQMESARRNVEVAMDGIKGALAAAFGDDIDAAASWVQRNRGPMMQFLADVIVGALDLGIAIVNGLAAGGDAVGELIAGPLAQLMMNLSLIGQQFDEMTLGDQSHMWRPLQEAASSAATFGHTLQSDTERWRSATVGALEDTQDAFTDWVGPEILSAHLHDMAVETAGRMAEIEERVAAADPTFQINGEAGNADAVLAETMEAIENSDGVLTINGESVLAENALDHVLALVEAGEESITIGAESTPGGEVLEMLLQAVADGEESVTINGKTVNAEDSLADLLRDIEGSDEEVTIGGRTVNAEDALKATLRAIRRGEEKVTIGGRTWEAQEAVSGLMSWVGNRRAKVQAGANTRGARSDVLNWVPPRKSIPTSADLSGARAALANWRPRKTVGITGVMMQATGGPVVGLATGGPVTGAGPKGVDSVPAGLAGGPVTHVLAPGEHVWTDGEVDAVGGHAGVHRLRRMARDGTLASILAASPLRGGGPVRPGEAGAAAAAVARLDPEVQALLVALANRPIQIGRRVLSEAVAEAAAYGATRGLRRD